MTDKNSFPKKIKTPSEIEIKNSNKDLVDLIFSNLKFNINAYKEVISIAKDESIIKKSISLIPSYLNDLNLCNKCANNSVRECLHKGRLGYRLTPIKKFNELDFVNSPCHKLIKLKKQMKKFNLFYDSEERFYLQGTELISFFNDLNENNRLKQTSEIGFLLDYVTNVVDKKSLDQSGYLISSKKPGLSSRLLKAIGLLFKDLDITITYINAKSIFDLLYQEESEESDKIFKLMCCSKLLLIDGLDQINSINDFLNEEYLGKLILSRVNDNLMTFATTIKPMNHKYITNKYFNSINNKSIYENALKKLFNLITITDSI